MEQPDTGRPTTPRPMTIKLRVNPFLDTDINMNFPFFKRVKSFDMLKEKVYEVSCGKGASCLNISFIEGFIGDGKTQFLLIFY